MKTVLVTGANGFLGSHLVRSLVEHGVAVTALDRAGCCGNLPQDPLVTFLPCELSGIAALDTTNIPRPDVFYHLAWQGVSPDAREDFELQKAHIDYSLDCVRLAAQLNAGRIILPGSTMEYLYNEAPIGPHSLPTPQNAYGAAKVAARYLCGELASSLGLPMVYMVFTGIYGVGREDKNVLFYTIDSLLRGQRPSVTRLEQRWDFVQIDDAVSALIAGGEKGKAGAFYAVGNGDNRPLAEFLYIVRDLIDPALPLGVGDVPYKDSRLPNSAIDTTALQADTGFTCQVPFREGIAAVIAHYRAKLNGEGGAKNG